ncbi:NAD(P)H-quinone dehydrogenase [Demequina sp. TTPB684]|uniref:NAD(P)H-quinone dehydrogenase n=1 Tax=unclassified Demequina TaxID=2620311 RepID=UPI001CF462BB|nr:MULTISPECIES: NAD(P)H-quinone dehydrogenase [unclassified Demequina]MCB2411585.1 NAD(P)H-quinone dehydrogenase [Demequina sp. TTPB684]UPU87256.1 NAD(P)H-quinone dehydrogenase [Demequina sp. TMPB413]
MVSVVIVGGGPGGYEAALVAAAAGAEVTLVERQGLGGNAVLTDVVPSKTVIATAEWLTIADRAGQLGIRDAQGNDTTGAGHHTVDLGAVNERVTRLAARQSADILARLEREGVRVVTGTAALRSPSTVAVDGVDYTADVVLLALGARPRVLPSSPPDGERILTWTQLYGLDTMPEHLVVVGSGVTGAEFAGAYLTLGAQVTLVSSGERVLATQDPEAAAHVQEEFARRGMTVLGGARAASVEANADGVRVSLTDGRVIEGSHCLMAIGSVPNTEDVGLESAGVEVDAKGYIAVDRVSRTSARGVYAAGDCTGVLPLASVAATQGRIAMAHALGDAVTPIELGEVASTVFTLPEIAAVGATEQELTDRGIFFEVSKLDLARNPRAKMLGIDSGFVKIFGHTVTGQILGAVVVGPRAGEHIFPLTLAVAHHLTVDDVSSAFTVYPSLSGTIAEAARRLHSMTEKSVRR